jgi:putative endonuclease
MSDARGLTPVRCENSVASTHAASANPGGIVSSRPILDRQRGTHVRAKAGRVANAGKADRLARYRRGRFSELLAAALLMAKGYRILDRRCRTPYGEIDLIAVRGKRLAFVEVKRRATRLEAEASLTPYQARRIVRAAAYWVSRHPRYRDHDRSLDAILVIPRRLPAHLRDALQIEFRT